MEPHASTHISLTRHLSDDILNHCDVLVVGVAEEEAWSQSAHDVDARQGGWVTRGIASGVISTKRGDMTLTPSPVAGGPDAILVVGLGDPDLIDRGRAYELGAMITRKLSDKPRAHVVISIADQIAEESHDALVCGAVTGCEGQSIYSSQRSIHPPTTLSFADIDDESIRQGRIIGESVNLTRRLVNQPPNMIFPDSFARIATDIAKEAGFEIEVWDEQRLAEERCRAILAVGGGSVHPPRLVIMQHRGGAEDDPVLAIVGKGITFDSGGLSIKPADGMVDMKCDMAGAATVLSVMRAATMMNLPINVLGICGLAENMISGSSYRVGDVIETRAGVRIEILNTDAEGRVVLADALDVAIGHKPVAIVDLATLTGACMVALGRDTVGLMTNDSNLCDQIAACAENEGEWAWELPMFSFFDEQVKSKVADIKNIGDGRWGGAITAAKFLERFVDKTPWVHMDIAGPAFAESPKPHRDAGGTGVMVRTLMRWLIGE